jgi:hypothetical protein
MALTLAGAVVLAGCGGGSEKPQPKTAPSTLIVAAAKRTTNAGPLGVQQRATGVLARGERLALAISGATDAKRRRAALRLAAARTGPGRASRAVRDVLDSRGEIFVDGPVYMYRNKLIARQTGSRSYWAAVDTRSKRVRKALGRDAAVLGLARPARPLDALSVAEGTATVVGHERVGGIDTTHYKSSANWARLVPEKGAKDTQKVINKLRDVRGSAAFPVEAWIDGRGYVRRMAASFDIGPIHLDARTEIQPTGARRPKPPPHKLVLDVTRFVPKGHH